MQRLGTVTTVVVTTIVATTSFVPCGTIKSITPQGWQGQQLETRFRKPLNAALQEFQAPFRPQGFIKSITPQGWQGQQLDVQFKRPFPASLQQPPPVTPPEPPVPPTGWQGAGTAIISPPPVIVAAGHTVIPKPYITPTGWQSGYQFEVRFKRPFPVQDQQYTPTEQPEAFPTERYGWWGQQLEVRFARPFPVTAQQFQAWPPQVVPLFFPPGAGKYPKIPSYVPQPDYEAKPNKPFRPVWDKPRQGTVEQPAPKAPSGPPPRPPASLFGTPGHAGDAKVNAPPALNLPSFDQYGMPDAAGFSDRMRESQDMSDAIAVLKKLGLLPNT